jgi:radical SAM superfamily enzyme YgiQ (UPF0313 family)
MSDECCWGITGEPVLPANILAAASQTDNAFYFDLAIDPPEKLAAMKPDLIVYPIVTKFKHRIHRRISKIARNVPKIAIGNPPGYMEEFAKMQPNPFCVVYSDPEKVFKDFHLVEDLHEWRANSKSVAWVEDGEYHQNEPSRTCIHEIKGTNWNLVPREYWPHYLEVIYQITRGCPHRCSFCCWGASTVSDRTFRMRPAEQVATDLTKLREIANRDRETPIHIYALNAQLTTDMKWIKEFHALTSDDPYPFKGNINFRELTAEKHQLLSESGMTTTSAGAEAITDPLLEKLNKCHDFEDVVRSINILNEAGAQYILHLKSGFGETRRDIRETLDNIIELRRRGIRHSRFHIASPIIYYKGTEIRKAPFKTIVYDPRFGAPRQKDILIDEWLHVKNVLQKLNLLNLKDPQYPLRTLNKRTWGWF